MNAPIEAKVAGLKAVIEYRLNEAIKEIQEYCKSKGRHEFYRESAKSNISYVSGILFAIDALGFRDDMLEKRSNEVFSRWVKECHQVFED